MANVHPWFGNVSIDQSAAWTYQFFEEQNVAAAAALSNHPTMFIAETGWPSVKSLHSFTWLDDLIRLDQASSDAGNANNGASAASVANLQTFLDTFVCQAAKNNSNYFYFETFDENWKVSRSIFG
jgi:exo-beta-1,3-glucanase (GH17 family)